MRREDLELVIEECAEVIQAATKILRFGVDDSHPTDQYGATNIEVFTEEVGQLLHCIDRLNLFRAALERAKARHIQKLLTYGPDGTYLAEKRAAAVADEN